MFTVGKARVYFKYRTIDSERAVNLYGVPEKYRYYGPLRSVLCYIRDVDGSKPFPYGIGYSICSPCDVFDKDKGRKIALADAIKHLSKKARAMIWEAYFAAQERSREQGLLEFIKAYLPDGWDVTFEEALEIARDLDKLASKNLQETVK